MNDLSVLIIVGLLGVGIGFALGSLLVGSRAEHVQNEQAKSSPGPNMTQIAILWIERGKKNLTLQVDDKLIRRSDELSGEQRARLKPAVEVLSAWFFPPAPPTEPYPVPIMTGQSPEVPATLAPISDDTGSKSDAGRPSINPVTVIARAMQSDVSVPGSSKSIALQVDEILQEKLKGTPLEKRGIRLMELPNKGMVVMVGLDQYDSVDAVRDEEARNLIRSAVAEWEDRFSNKQ